MCDGEVMNWYAREQQDLAAALRRAGPDAPTLCEGWQTRHLAAHLYLRLHRPWRMAGEILPGVAGADALTIQLGDEHAAGGDYAQLLDDFLAPPARVNPMGMAGDAMHLLEYVVHHEDVRRAGGHDEPRTLPRGQQAALWHQVRRMGRLTQARQPHGLVLVVPGGPRAVARQGRRSVAVCGSVVELALYLTGRTEHADVDLVAVAPSPSAPGE